MDIDSLSLWLVLGLLLLISEMLTTSFFLVFVAVGCFAAALASSLGVSLGFQIAVCAVTSVAGVFTLRKKIQKKLLKSINLSADIGKEIRVDESMAPHKQTRISYQGTTWLATNLGAEEVKQGDRVVIVGIDGNILLIRKVN